jgi:hypothetical protein
LQPLSSPIVVLYHKADQGSIISFQIAVHEVAEALVLASGLQVVSFLVPVHKACYNQFWTLLFYQAV